MSDKRTKLVTNMEILVGRVDTVDQAVQSVMLIERDAEKDVTALRLFRRHSEDPGYPFIPDSEVVFKEVDPNAAVAFVVDKAVDQDGHTYVERSKRMPVHALMKAGVRP